MNPNKNMPEVKKTYEFKKGKDPAEVKIPKELQYLMINSKQKGFSIHVVRVFVKILARIKGTQIMDKNQLKLFSEEFFMDTTSTVAFNFKYRDFLPDGYTSIEPVKKAMLFLRNFERDVWREVQNHEGDKIEFSEGLIMHPVFNKTSEFLSFQMNAYWYDKFLNLSKDFNTGLIDLFFGTKSINTIVFYNYLTTLKGSSGTKIKLSTINDKFGTNYKSSSELFRSFLSPIKKDLDSKSDLSFNFSRADNDAFLIHIKLYVTDNHKENSNLTKNQLDKTKIKSKIYYLRDKHGLDESQLKMLKVSFEKHGYDFLNKILKDSKKEFPGSLKGAAFLSKFSAYYSQVQKLKKFDFGPNN